MNTQTNHSQSAGNSSSNPGMIKIEETEVEEKVISKVKNTSPPDYEALRDLIRPHIESFDYFVDKGLETMLENIKPVEVIDPHNKNKLRISLENHTLLRPEQDRKALLPNECRQRKISYAGRFLVEICFQYNDTPAVSRRPLSFGQLPIMLKSKLCHLRDASPKKLISCGEESTEMGGYFILNGLERLVRLIILQKRNYPMSVVRNSFRERQEGYTDKAVTIRCVREDQSSVTVKLYYLQNGSARLGFWIDGREYLLPVGLVLKALINTNDKEIYKSLTCCNSKGNGAIGTQLVGERVKIILDEVSGSSFCSRNDCLHHIGEHFQPVMNGMENEKLSNVGEAVLRDYIFVHLKKNDDKFNLLIFMMQKLFALVDHTAAPDNTDALQNQEVLLPGHLITIYLKEKLQQWLYKVKKLIEDEIKKKGDISILSNQEYLIKIMGKASTKSISNAIENMLKTGRLVTLSGLDIQQRAGMSVQAERLNFLRFLSHFRAVHRGASFAGLRSTSVRKLLPESWGFLCPVHTPDGEPCGLLNHMTSTCRITSYYDAQGSLKIFANTIDHIKTELVSVGMVPSQPKLVQAGPPEVLNVLLDGCVIGSISSSIVEKAVADIRKQKLLAPKVIPADLEVGYVPLTMGGAYPGLYLFTSPSRFIRPVRNICINSEENLNNIELIGPFEQAYMEIRCADGGDGGRKDSFPATHEEIHPTAILSVVASLTPWSDHNQSPRNMYQCQMAKQTMAFSSQALQFRSDQKLYHLQVETIDLEDQSRKSDKVLSLFARSNLNKSSHSSIDSDGLPHVGQIIQPGEPYCSTYNTISSKTKQFWLKGSEPVVVDYVAVDGGNLKKPLQKVNVRFRRRRNPVIGDKFSSRHGQKGVCSQLWPDIDMPFSGVTGMRPDLIINPHAFPSRMTIAMLFESIAAKVGSLHGKFIDATPFDSSTKKSNGESSSQSSLLTDELGPMLASYGFQYHGSEVLYSGVLGKELKCEIFMGPVYYQRLRHMVSDKFQVRSTGPVDQVTRQPIKGRKYGGGIRFGEMERDAMLAHGAAYLLHDRLHTSSDHHIADVCSLCGSLLTSLSIQPKEKAVREIVGLPPARTSKKVTCKVCDTSRGMETVAMPYVFRYLAAELAAMNVKMNLRLSSSKGA
ncbi:hypothetical protein GIB67_015018 [Kingdonia uniflora]|uniref:DNA-directed RNA polymerase subunit beta n=1 Tax=Kingdonia uniflora TaxID=39325 RepID=A0A7J7MTR2_9MAGN|nr:hypothetical protein GIB67_015018 [Kingdonia uniflora]